MFTSMIIGRIGRAAETKDINGKNYYKFPIAVDGTRKDSPATWVNVLYYKREGGRLGDYLIPGASVAVQGRQDTSAYVGKDGKAHPDITIWADQLTVTRYAKEEGAEREQAGGDLPAGDNDVDLPF